MEKLGNSGRHDEALKATMMDLATTQQEIVHARESTNQSSLECEAFIYELEKQRSIHATTKEQVTMATAVIASLGSLLETTTTSTETKQEEEHKNKTTIKEMSQARKRDQQQLLEIVAEIEEEKEGNRKLHEELHLKKQSLETLQLKQRAVDMEIEAFSSSLNLTCDQLKQLELDNEMVAISHEEFCSLHREVNKETTMANWRLAASNEERHAAEVNKDKALRRLETLDKEKQLKESMIAMVLGEMQSNNKAIEVFGTTQTVVATRARASQEHQNQVIRRSQKFERKPKGKRNKKMYKNKPTILRKILKFLCAGL